MTQTQTPEQPPNQARTDIPVGVSACILGQEVRFDGGHKLSRFVRDTLGAYLRFVPVCPEFDIGLGVPRETLRLVKTDAADPDSVRLLAPKSQTDHTRKMKTYARKKAEELGAEALCGYIVQKGSPTCGMERVRIYPQAGGAPAKNGRGLFTSALLERFPTLPVEEDGRLNDPRLRENFIERVFAYRRVRLFFAGQWTVGQLVAFHTREKLLLMAHDRPAYQALGRIVAGAKALPRDQVASDYERLMLTGLKKLATRGKQTNVLQHITGHFKKVLDAGDREELQAEIQSYQAGLVPLIVPITLLRHHIRRHGIDYLAQQTYIDPHPAELMLRNHG
ncbi:MAG: hypothetical protein ACI9KE_006699 [Polyangiales bacterium]|jgi:uncharacterized protein YbgA (DUF1722 family)/uncharacterized protein YbbK (DUF523 family)